MADGTRAWWVIAGMVLGLTYYYLVPSPALALPGLVAFAALAWRRLDLALALLPLTFPFWYVPRPVAGTVVFPLSEIALAVCVAVALGREVLRFRSGQRTLRLRRRALALAARLGPWLLIGSGLLVVGLTLGVVIARRPHEALRAYRWEVIEPLLYLALVTCYVRRRLAVRVLVWAMLASALLLAVLATLQIAWLHVTFTPLAAGNRLVPYTTAGDVVPRATAFIYGSGNSLGAWLERALPLALALSLRGVARGERLFAALTAAVCVPALVWSASRGAWVGAAVGCLLVLLLVVRRMWLPVVVALAAMVIALWRRDALASAVLAGHGGSGEMRLLVWLAALRMLRDHPLLGIGPDQFLYYYSNRYTDHPYWITRLNGHQTSAWREPNLAHPHNLPLDLWLSGGVLALAGFTIVLADLWRRCLRLWHAGANAEGAARWRGAVALGVGASVLAGIVHGMVDSAYFVPDLALAFWWAAALLIILERLPVRPGAE